MRVLNIARYGAALLTLAASLQAGTPGAQNPPAQAPQTPPDIIYYNGHIVTMWAEHPVVEAVAIRGDRFVAVGTTADVRQLAPDPTTREVDLRGRTVLPGLEDSHTHPITAALSEQDGPIPVMNSIADILSLHPQAGARHAAGPGDLRAEDLLDASRRAPLSHPLRARRSGAGPRWR